MLLRLQRLLIDTLEQRPIKADFSLFFKLHRNLGETDIKEVFTYRNNGIIRGHNRVQPHRGKTVLLLK